MSIEAKIAQFCALTSPAHEGNKWYGSADNGESTVSLLPF